MAEDVVFVEREAAVAGEIILQLGQLRGPFA